ncbi:ciliogenesis-associated TTC17-interacting protein isoform X1 [Dendroctonus ponderosae]|uniref:ciliogenesis-associated TTC17-interacting protein isoform X1 n=1 Tax=Dendroctonus ponderosae TaxID=77166 RepID=UPI0020357306|nr:ciliogenesis-associated TTC17-interacting protein isoform X1 [Dendroctonus ponderosae]KAH1018382.1 hypothetical protein HUJ05_006168 [Dendroctonus ponderosae]
MTEPIKQAGSIEKYLEETIFEYLRGQTEVAETYAYDFNKKREPEQTTAEDPQKILCLIEDLLNDLLDDVDRTVLYEAEYQKAYKSHHQYALFELADIIPGFSLDNTLIRQLCFRETLLISNVDQQQAQQKGNGIKPQGVGGMCLKVELVRGMPPKQKLSEEDSDKTIVEKLKEIKEELARSKTVIGASPQEETESEKLRKYEEFLQEQMFKTPHKFVVHLSTEFNVDGQNAGSRVISWVDKDLHTLEERRTEYLFREDISSTKQVLYYALQDSKYFVKHQQNTNETTETRKYYPLSKTKDMIGEGANFILMRYLAITKYTGSFEMSTIYINGDMCRNIYDCKGPKPGIVNGHKIDLCKIYRTIIEECGIIHLSVTVLTVYGMIVSQEWEGCPYIIHINPLFVTKGKPVPYDCVALKKVWETNMEMVSKYLDCKVEAEFKMKTYLKDHPEIQDMLSDYLNSVLLLKPENVMPFTVDYFMNFEPYSLPELPYFDDFDENKVTNESEMFW